jgi:serine/threonine protein kinase
MVKRQTRKKITGALGEGFYGIAYNSRSNTLYDQFKEDRIQSIRLQTQNPKDEQVINDEAGINDFLHFLKTRNDIIVKTYKTTYLLTGTRHKDNYRTEIQENRKIIGLYGPEAKNYLTIYPISGFRDLDILGAVFTLRHRRTVYMLFGHRCNNHYDVKPTKMVKDLLKSLVVLQKSKYLHNDIKLENIVLCGSTYKLIDWGQAGGFHQFHMGDMIGTSPIKWYMMGYPNVFTDNIMALRTQMVNSSFKFSKLFREVNEQVQTEYHEVIGSGISYAALVKRYVPSFDVFMVGMLLLRAIHKFHLNQQIYLPIVKKLVSLKEPLDAKAALAAVTTVTKM